MSIVTDNKIILLFHWLKNFGFQIMFVLNFNPLNTSRMKTKKKKIKLFSRFGLHWQTLMIYMKLIIMNIFYTDQNPIYFSLFFHIDNNAA